MRPVAFSCVIAIGLAACASDPTTDNTGWSYYGHPVKGQASLEKQFRDDDGKCRGSDMSIYKPCMFGRGYSDIPVYAAAPAMPAAAPTAISNAPPDWRVRAAEARGVAAQLQDPRSKQMMLAIAQTYDRLAVNSEGRVIANSRSAPTR